MRDASNTQPSIWTHHMSAWNMTTTTPIAQPASITLRYVTPWKTSMARSSSANTRILRSHGSTEGGILNARL